MAFEKLKYLQVDCSCGKRNIVPIRTGAIIEVRYKAFCDSCGVELDQNRGILLGGRIKKDTTPNELD